MSKTKFVSGFRDGIPIALGYLAVSFGLGISCRAASLTPFQGFLLSLLNNASAGEYGGITIMAADEGFLVMAAMMLVINARYLLMGCVLSQKLSPDLSLGHRMLMAFDLTDEIFGLAVAQQGMLDPWYYYGAMCAALPGWSCGTVVGVLLGQSLPEWAVSGCSVMLFGMFIAIILPEGKRNPVVLGFLLLSFLCSWAGAKLPPLAQLSEGMRILVLTVILAALAAALFPRKEEEEAAE
mgnify:FL=1